MKMDPQGTNPQQPPQVQGQQQQQRYCPTPMAPPSPAPTPPIQHHPPPSMSPAPHTHTGYYGHHTHHSYPPPQHNPYYTNYYGHSSTTHHHAQQPANPTPPPPQHYQQQHQQQQQQQWPQHHGYYQQASQQTQQPQQQQTSGYPPHSPSPNPYAYMQQQQHQQPQPTPQQQQTQLGSPLGSPQGPSMTPPQGLGQQSPVQQQQQPQMQSQHALMNLSRFVSQQSPCPSPSPHPQSPTTPLPPMGSPQHYQPPQQMGSHQGHLNMMGQQTSLHHPQQQMQQQHPLQSTTPTPPIHQPTYSPTSLSASQQQQISHPNQNTMMNMSQHVSNTSGGGMNNHLMNNYGNTSSQSVSSLGGMPSTNSASSVSTSSSQGMTSVGNGGNVLANPVNNVNEQGSNKSHPPNYGSPTPSGSNNTVTNDPHGSGSTSPTGSSSSTTRNLSSPSLTSSVNSANNGQMLPVRLQNMQRGPRTKASMRKFLEEQHSSSSAAEASQEGTLLSDQDVEIEAQSTQSSKKSQKKPRSPKKGAKGAQEEKGDMHEGTPKKSSKKRATTSKRNSGANDETTETANALETPPRPGYSKRGIKIGRPTKSKSIDEPGKEPPQKKAKKGKKGAAVAIDFETSEVTENASVPTASQSESSLEMTVESEEQATTVEPEAKVDNNESLTEESPNKTISSTPSGKEEIDSSSPTPASTVKMPAKRSTKRTKSNSKKGKKDDEDWQLHQTTESESEGEGEEEEEYAVPEVDRTPRRPLRPRVSKETPKSEETETPLRSRYARARRSSSSYKEVSMSSSRSKSPKETPAPTPSPKKSPRGGSPAKAPAAKASNSKKASSKSVPIPKSSPRLKEASPSPVRLRQLKASSPDEGKRELRSSKEREETPKRPSRGRQTQNSKDAQQDTPGTPPSSRRSSKSPRDPTPIRVSSPRLAKEKSAVSPPAAKAPSNRRKNSVEMKAVDTPLVVEEENVSPTQTTKGKKTPAKSRAKKEAVKEPAAETSVSEVEGSSPTIPPSTGKKGAKKGKGSAGGKKAKAAAKKGKKSQKEEEDDQQSKELISLRAEESEQQSELLIDETACDDSQQSSQVEQVEKLAVAVADKTTGSVIDLSGVNPPSVTPKSSRRASTTSESSRRSRSPRVRSGGKSPEMIATANAALMAQCSSPRVIIPHLTVNDLPKKYGEEQLSPDYAKMNTNSLSLQVASVLPAMESPTGKIAHQRHPGESLEVNVPNAETEEKPLNSPEMVPSDPPKKVRKPRAPKAPKPPPPPLPVLEQPPEDPQHMESSPESADKRLSKQKAEKIQFQQRKADLEVEVAQVLLGMKNSSKSPSPSKGFEHLISSAATTPGADNIGDISVAFPAKAAAKGKKRKNSTVSTAPDTSMSQSGGESSENMTLNANPVKQKRAYNRKKAVPRDGDLKASTDPAAVTTKKQGGRKKSGGANEGKEAKTPKSRKKPSMSTDMSAADLPPPPDVPVGFSSASEQQSMEGLPSMEISPGASIYSVSTSISFQNSPVKVPGPVKVSKTVTIPEADVVAANVEGAVQESPGKSKGKTKEKSPAGGAEKSRKKKTVVPKALTPTVVPNSGEKPPKRKYNRKKSKEGPSSLTQCADNQIKVEPKNIVAIYNPQAGDGPAAVDTGAVEEFPMPNSSVVEKGGNKASTSDSANPNNSVSVKKRRKSSTPKVQSMELLPFQLQPRPMPIPTVFAKPSPLAALKNGSGAGGSSSDSKDKALVGPSLKVIGGKTTFYRGSDEEEVDSEPPIPKRTNVEYDPNVPWLCCFCNLGPHAQKLGDLFGPYYAELPNGSGKTKCLDKKETWMHQDCALWAGNVVLIGTKLHNLEETLSHSNEDACTTCGQKGATIGCLKRGCKQAVHFPCAVRKSWKLDQETFQSFCPAHLS